MVTKAFLYPISLLIFLTIANPGIRAQQNNKPAATGPAIPSVHITPDYSTGIKVNFVRTWEAAGPVQTSNEVLSASEMEVDTDIKTKQFKHKGSLNLFGMGWLANEDENGLAKDDIITNSGTSTDHSIFTFINDISSLEEGTYKWDNENKKWIKQ